MRPTTRWPAIVLGVVTLACTSKRAPGDAERAQSTVARTPDPTTSAEPVAAAEPEPEAPAPSVEVEAASGTPRDVWFDVPAELAACERDWLLAKQPPPEVTARCIGVFLEYGYGGIPDEEQLDFDPYYGSRIELRYTRSQLDRMAALAEASCAANPEQTPTRCERGVEFLSGMARRKTELFDDVNVDGIEGALAKILAGERLDPDDLWLEHEGLGFSELAIWKLEAAIAARHGQPFADEDLDAFFYSDRHESWAELGLPELAPNPKLGRLELDAADRHNRALIERALARSRGQTIDDSHCFVHERVLFDCELADGSTASVCGSATKHPPTLDWVVLRHGTGKTLDSIPAGPVLGIETVARFGRDGGHIVVEIDGDDAAVRIERERLKGDARRYRFILIIGDDAESLGCTAPRVDELDAIGEAIPKKRWIEVGTE